MNESPVQVILDALRFCSVVGSMYNPALRNGSEVDAITKSIEQILKINPDTELDDMLTQLSAKQAAAQRASFEPVSEQVTGELAVLSYYETQMVESKPQPARRRKTKH